MEDDVPIEWLESNEVSYTLYTSGTTGTPKGVQRDVGGYAVALLVYILNKGQYHPLVRPAILTSLLGYGLAVLAVDPFHAASPAARLGASPSLADALAPGIGILLRERAAS